MDNIRIQDDLYTHVNQAKLDELVIPDDMPVTGSAMALMTGIEKLMIGEFNTMCENGSYPNDHMARACRLYALAKDVKRRKKHGIRPALKHLSVLKKVGTMRSFNLRAKELMLSGITMPISISSLARRLKLRMVATFFRMDRCFSAGLMPCFFLRLTSLARA